MKTALFLFMEPFDFKIGVIIRMRSTELNIGLYYFIYINVQY